MNLRTLPRSLAASALLLSSACSDLPLGQETRVPTRVAIGETESTIVQGRSFPLSVTVFDQHDRAFERLPQWVVPEWSSTSPAVDVTGGRLVAREPGIGRAVVSIAGLTGAAEFRVNPAALRLEVMGAYVTQGVQRWDGSLPLVQDRDAMLRVFVRGNQVNFFRPMVRASFSRDGAPTQVLTLPAQVESVPVAVSEDDLVRSWNVKVPGSLVQPGTSVEVEVDPERTITRAAGSRPHFDLRLDVRAVPELRLTLVPVHQAGWSGTGGVTEANKKEYVGNLVEMFPIGRYDVRVRAPYTTSARADTDAGWHTILSEIYALQRTDGGSRHYYGLLDRGEKWGGMGYIGVPASVGLDRLPGAAGTLAHELGHNFGRRHAPCGDPAGVDPRYPYPNARLGVYGFDSRSQSVLSPGKTHDLMSYCGPQWISDYTYQGVLEFRDASARRLSSIPSADARPALLVWGRISDGVPILEPAFEVTAAAAPPLEPGPHRIEILDDRGTVLTARSFQAAETDHGGTAQHFALTVPLDRDQMERVAEIRFSSGAMRATRSSATSGLRASRSVSPGGDGRAARLGVQPAPGGRLAVTWDAGNHPMALVRDPQTGEILSFARNGRTVVAARGESLEVLLSDGVRTTREHIRIDRPL